MADNSSSSSSGHLYLQYFFCFDTTNPMRRKSELTWACVNWGMKQIVNAGDSIRRLLPESLILNWTSVLVVFVPARAFVFVYVVLVCVRNLLFVCRQACDTQTCIRCSILGERHGSCKELQNYFIICLCANVEVSSAQKRKIDSTKLRPCHTSGISSSVFGVRGKFRGHITDKWHFVEMPSVCGGLR